MSTESFLAIWLSQYKFLIIKKYAPLKTGNLEMETWDFLLRPFDQSSKVSTIPEFSVSGKVQKRKLEVGKTMRLTNIPWRILQIFGFEYISKWKSRSWKASNFDHNVFMEKTSEVLMSKFRFEYSAKWNTLPLSTYVSILDGHVGSI